MLLIGLGLEAGSGFGVGWQTFFVLHGIVCAGGVMLGATLLSNPPAGWSPPGWQPTEAESAAIGETQWRQMLDTPLACMLWLTFIFGATSGLMAIGQWKPMMGHILGDRTFAPAWMGTFGRFVEPVGILAIFNALGRIFWGKISDLIDRPRAMMIMFLAQGMAFMILVSVQSPLAIFLASAWVGTQLWRQFCPLSFGNSRLFRQQQPRYELRLDIHRLWCRRYPRTGGRRRLVRHHPAIHSGLCLCRYPLLHSCRLFRCRLGAWPGARLMETAS